MRVTALGFQRQRCHFTVLSGRPSWMVRTRPCGAARLHRWFSPGEKVFHSHGPHPAPLYPHERSTENELWASSLAPSSRQHVGLRQGDHVGRSLGRPRRDHTPALRLPCDVAAALPPERRVLGAVLLCHPVLGARATVAFPGRSGPLSEHFRPKGRGAVGPRCAGGTVRPAVWGAPAAS